MVTIVENQSVLGIFLEEEEEEDEEKYGFVLLRNAESVSGKGLNVMGIYMLADRDKVRAKKTPKLVTINQYKNSIIPFPFNIVY